MNKTKLVFLFVFSFGMTSLFAQTVTNYDSKTLARKTTLGQLKMKESIAFTTKAIDKRNLMVTEMFYLHLNTLNFDAMSALFSDEFKQHAADVPDGFDGFQDYVEAKDNGTAGKWNRYLDLSVVLTEKDHIITLRKGNMNDVVFDIMKFNDMGQVAECWSFSQTIPDSAENARLMYDIGDEYLRPVKMKSETVTANKAIVTEFIETAYKKGKRKKAAKKLMTENCIQHHPDITDGLEAFGASAKKLKYTMVNQMMFSQNDLVFVLSKASETVKKGETSQAFALAQLFRVRKGKICEQWEVWMEVPENLAHTNGLF